MAPTLSSTIFVENYLVKSLSKTIWQKDSLTKDAFLEAYF